MPKTKTGDYVVCQKPPPHFYEPLERLMSYEHVITFSNGHALYLLSQTVGARGPNADYNITDEVLTIDKVKFDQEAAATNRGNEEMFGFRSQKPIYKHHGSTFTSSMAFLPEHKRTFGTYRTASPVGGEGIPCHISSQNVRFSVLF